jgi:probable DNA metabolism protein
MIERAYDGSLEGLFSILDEVYGAAVLPGHIRRGFPPGGQAAPPEQPGLFGEDGAPHPASRSGASLPLQSADSASALTGSARDLYAVSADVFDAFVCAWMSELPIEAEIVRFGGKVLVAAKGAAEATVGAAARKAVRQAAGAAAGKTAPADWTGLEEARLGAERAARDRGDADVRVVLGAAYKVGHEIDRLRGLLRFSPNSDGVYIARCAPDHFVLPALAAHFTRRFGEQGWAIIDERRKLCLSRRSGESPELFEFSSPLVTNDDPWESLWRHYHRTINNESRKNPRLQRQFMPERYWKYLPEINTKTV